MTVRRPFITVLLMVAFFFIGNGFGTLLNRFNATQWNVPLSVAFFVLVALFLGGDVGDLLDRIAKAIMESVQRWRPSKVLSGVVGAVVGLLITVLLIIPLFFLEPLTKTPDPEQYNSWITLAYFFTALLLMYVFATLFSNLNIFAGLNLDNPMLSEGAIPKIIDSNALIDGRIYEVVKTGFVEAPFIIPSSVLKELQYIADAHDPVKREKGRRGLDLVKKMMDDLDIRLRILEEEFRETVEVDSIVIKVARSLRGAVITNDYNLNKVAAVYNVKILNINDLANAIKTQVHHGDVMTVDVVKYGKEPGQGLGYLEDGTMVVVEEGEEFISKKVDVAVTSVLQTSAGRIIFTRPLKSGRR